MKKIFLILLATISINAYAQTNFETPTFSYGGQIYKVRGVGNFPKRISNSNSKNWGRLIMPEVPNYCSIMYGDFPISWWQTYNLVMQQNAILFTPQRRAELLTEKAEITLFIDNTSRQVKEVRFFLGSKTKLTQEEIYRIEQHYKTLFIPFKHDMCTYNYLYIDMVIEFSSDLQILNGKR